MKGWALLGCIVAVDHGHAQMLAMLWSFVASFIAMQFGSKSSDLWWLPLGQGSSRDHGRL